MILEKYITLFLYFEKLFQRDITTSIEEISEVLFCTPRNSKSILKKLVSLRWIHWTSGIGRGNKSKLIFLEQPYNLIITKSMEFVKKGEIKSGRSLIEEYKGMYPDLVVEFNSWIDTLFGYNVEVKGNKKLDIVRLRLEMTPIVEHLDPIKITLRSDRHILRQISDTLLQYNPATKEFEPRIAFHWEYNEGKRSWYIYLNKGIKFHNGRLLTSKDVVYTFHRFKNSTQNAYKWMMEDLESVQAVEEYILEFKLKSCNQLFLHFLSDEHLSILPYPSGKSMEEKIDKFPIGTGPFKIVRNDEDILILETNAAYFKGRAFLDRIELWSIKDNEHLANQNNEMKYDLYPKEIGNTNEGSDMNRMEYLEKGILYLTVNLNKSGPFQNVYFRKAFRNILNTTNMVKELAGERYEAAKGFLFSNDREVEFLEPHYIKELLQKSEYKGEVLNLYTYNHGIDHAEDAAWIQKECEKFGVKINVKLLDSEDLSKAEIIEEADSIHDMSTVNESVEISCLDVVLSDTSFVKHHLDPSLKKEVNGKIREVYESDRKAKRIELLKSIEDKILSRDNVIPLYRIQMNLQSHAMIQNASFNTFGWIDFYHIWFRKPGLMEKE